MHLWVEIDVCILTLTVLLRLLQGFVCIRVLWWLNWAGISEEKAVTLSYNSS